MSAHETLSANSLFEYLVFRLMIYLFALLYKAIKESNITRFMHISPMSHNHYQNIILRLFVRVNCIDKFCNRHWSAEVAL